MKPQELFHRLGATLATRPFRSLGALPVGVRDAAVLVPFFEKAGEAHLLFVKRPDGDYRHAGQIAFPGGVRDPDEAPVPCALREAKEEVGLNEADVHVLGRLDEYDTVVTGFRVSPVVGVIPYPYPLTPDPFEVERLIEVPVTTLLDPAVVRVEHHKLHGDIRPIWFYQAGRDLIWGVTAGMLAQVLDIVRAVSKGG